MDLPHPRSTAPIGGNPIHAALVPFPIACFTLTLLTDVAYWRTGNLMWQNFSSWLLFAGLVAGGLAALVAVFDLLARSRGHGRRPAWPYVVGGALVLLAALVNSLVHAGDGWTAIVPRGLALSAATFLLVLVTAWLGRSSPYRRRVGVIFHD